VTQHVTVRLPSIILLAPLVASACASTRAQDSTEPAAANEAEDLRENYAVAPQGTIEAQLGRGALVFEENCDLCHGARGQGREGVIDTPQVTGEGALASGEHAVSNAQQLYDYVSANMPEDSPGSLSREQYWDVVAYLASENGVELTGQVDPESASTVTLPSSP